MQILRAHYSKRLFESSVPLFFWARMRGHSLPLSVTASSGYGAAGAATFCRKGAFFIIVVAPGLSAGRVWVGMP